MYTLIICSFCCLLLATEKKLPNFPPPENGTVDEGDDQRRM
jgi:hypothetical protein